YLREHGVPVETQTRHLRYSRDEQPEYPVLLFAADELPFDLTVLPRDAQRQAPLDRTDDRPMRRAALAQVEILLIEEADDEFEQRLASALR
ncbi:MAG TPA: hypothetical protein VGG00_05265, partial [Rhodanobacter sp.]